VANHGWKRPDKRLPRTQATAIVARSPERAREDPMLDARVAAAEREAVLDKILTDLWKGQLTREAAVGRIMAKLGMNQRAARDEVDGFLRD
jgi:hypothetical protein